MPSTAETLISDALRGRITPEQAEIRARELGLGPLAGPPPPDRYDPFAELAWTLAMSVAWIAKRDPHEVQKRMPYWRMEATVWRRYENGWTKIGARKVPSSGAFIGPIPFAFAPLFELASKLCGNVEGQQAWMVLQRSLSRGDLVAYGMGDGGPAPIPAFHWPRLCPTMTKGERDALHWIEAGRIGDRAYDGSLTIDRDALIELFPPIGTNAQEVSSSDDDPAAVTSASEWYRNGGETAAIEALRGARRPITEGAKAIAAASIWNARRPDRPVTPQAFKKAKTRAAKKSRVGTK